MPVQVIPHMYRMLGDEIQWANDEVCAVRSIQKDLTFLPFGFPSFEFIAFIHFYPE